MSMQIQEVTMPYELEHMRKASPEALARLLELVKQGESLGRAARAIGVEMHALSRWREQSPEFNERLTAALDAQHDELADRLITAHEDIPDPAKAKLFSDNVKWLVSKRDKRYGDKLDINVEHKVDLAGALTEARGRVLSASYQRISEPAELPVIPSESVESATDAISGDAPDAPTLDDLLS